MNNLHESAPHTHTHTRTQTHTYNRHAVNCVLRRGAQSDRQQEEQAIFYEAVNAMDSTLMNEEKSKKTGRASDSAAKMLHRNKNANMTQFLSGAAKRELVDQRKTGEAEQQQYYSYKFT